MTDYVLAANTGTVTIGSYPIIMAFKRWADTHGYRQKFVLQDLRSAEFVFTVNIAVKVPAINRDQSYLLLADNVYLFLLADNSSRLKLGR